MYLLVRWCMHEWRPDVSNKITNSGHDPCFFFWQHGDIVALLIASSRTPAIKCTFITNIRTRSLFLFAVFKCRAVVTSASRRSRRIRNTTHDRRPRTRSHARRALQTRRGPNTKLPTKHQRLSPRPQHERKNTDGLTSSIHPAEHPSKIPTTPPWPS